MAQLIFKTIGVTSQLLLYVIRKAHDGLVVIIDHQNARREGIILTIPIELLDQYGEW